MNKKVKSLIGAALVALGAYYIASPYVAANSLAKAVQTRNAEAASEYIDFSALRVSVRDKLQAKVAQEAAKDGAAGAVLGMAFASMLIEPIVNAFVSPQGLIAVLNGEEPQMFGEEKEASKESTEKRLVERTGKANFSIKYSGLNKVEIVNKDKPSDGGFIFTRHGLFKWKITELSMKL